jgi:predicted transcriptional regulator
VKTYRATVTREAGYWVAVVDGLRAGATEARTLAGLEVEVRDLVAGLTDSDEDAFEVELELSDELEEVRSVVAATERLRETLAQVRSEFEETQREAARVLHAEQLSARDSAKLIGISHQRVSQLLSAAEDAGWKTRSRSAARSRSQKQAKAIDREMARKRRLGHIVKNQDSKTEKSISYGKDARSL